MRPWLGVAVSLLSAGAAAEAPRVAVHPLVVVAGDARAVEQSRAAFLAEAARQQIEMVSHSTVTDALETQPGKSCLDHEGCLEDLCKHTDATYAVLATLMLDGPDFVLEARVVAVDGTLMKLVHTLVVPRDLFTPRAPQVQAALKTLFEQLELGALPATLPPRAPQVVAKQPETQPVETKPIVEVPVVAAPAGQSPAIGTELEAESSPGSRPLRVVGFVAGGAALVAGGVGTALAISASSRVEPLRAKLVISSDGKALAPSAAVADEVRALDRQNALATGLLVGAGVAAAAAIALIVASVDWRPAVVAVPVKGGAVVGLSGEF